MWIAAYLQWGFILFFVICRLSQITSFQGDFHSTAAECTPCFVSFSFSERDTVGLSTCFWLCTSTTLQGRHTEYARILIYYFICPNFIVVRLWGIWLYCCFACCSYWSLFSADWYLKVTVLNAFFFFSGGREWERECRYLDFPAHLLLTCCILVLLCRSGDVGCRAAFPNNPNC